MDHFHVACYNMSSGLQPLKCQVDNDEGLGFGVGFCLLLHFDGHELYEVQVVEDYERCLGQELKIFRKHGSLFGSRFPVDVSG